jgi:hypothetical protein
MTGWQRVKAHHGWRAARAPGGGVFGERHLRHLLNSYQKYYNEACTHPSLHKDAPIPRTIQTVGRTLAMPVLGGLHHQYFRA